jgi:hypothetical protein
MSDKHERFTYLNKFLAQQTELRAIIKSVETNIPEI